MAMTPGAAKSRSAGPSSPAAIGAATTNREVKRLMLDHAFTFVDTVIFWVGEQNWRSQGAMTKIGGVRRDGLFTREVTGATPHFIFEIGKVSISRAAGRWSSDGWMTRSLLSGSRGFVRTTNPPATKTPASFSGFAF